jgi:threonine/homoserine/homoserine lactone efflux protein
MPLHPSPALGAAAIVLMVAISITWYVVVTCLFTMPWMARAYHRTGQWIERVAGTLFVLFGVRLVLGR